MLLSEDKSLKLERLWKGIEDSLLLKDNLHQELANDLPGEQREFYTQLLKSTDDILDEALSTFASWVEAAQA